MRAVAMAGALFLIASPVLAAAGAYPGANCTLNADKSRMNVVASNGSGKSYTCLVTCRVSVAGQRAFDPFQCQFVLRAHAAPKVVCGQKGGHPGAFTAVSPTRSTCVPR
jgi:hypothetical protein